MNNTTQMQYNADRIIDELLESLESFSGGYKLKDKYPELEILRSIGFKSRLALHLGEFLLERGLYEESLLSKISREQFIYHIRISLLEEIKDQVREWDYSQREELKAHIAELLHYYTTAQWTTSKFFDFVVKPILR